jgi:DNA-binding SARP family transcriptional activator
MLYQQTADESSPSDPAENDGARYSLLGPMEVLGCRNCTPKAPKMRSVLALLLLRQNQIVPRDLLIDELWGSEPPRSVITAVQTYVYQLRKLFVAEGLNQPECPLLTTKSPGYLLHTEPGQVDADVFECLVQQGRNSMEKGSPRQAAADLNRALDMWTGPALADVPQGPQLEAHAVRLDRQRISALELRIQADISLGRQRQLIPELSSLVSMYPLNEWFHGQLIAALDNAGRRGEALLAYQNLRDVLNTELGVDPSADLQRLQRQVLCSGDPQIRR